MYGGRAIDSFDRRILTVYMDEYLGDFLFDTFQVFHFYKSDTIDYKIPAGKGKDDFVGKKCFSCYIKKKVCFQYTLSPYLAAGCEKLNRTPGAAGVRIAEL